MWYKDGRLALDLTVLVLFLFEVVSLSSVQCSQDVWQYVVLYTGKDGSGEPLTIMAEDSENLEQLGFGNAQSECHVGAWIHFGGRFSENYGKLIYLRPAGCNNKEYSGKSIRFVGDPSNYTRDSLTLYETLGFAKAKEVFYTDGNVKITSVESMAATGSSDWTIYKDPNYEGDSYCFKFTFVDYAHFVVQFTVEQLSGFTGNIGGDWISSVKKGCHSSSVVKPTPNDKPIS